LVSDLVKEFRSGSWSGGRPLKAVRGVSFDVGEGEVLGLVGESGSGKSTTARCIVRLVEPTSGRIEIAGRDILSARGRKLAAIRRDVQIVFQDPYSSLNPRFTVEQLIGEGIVVHRLVASRTRLRERVAELLEMVGMGTEHLGRYPRAFSGGQRQRIAIARALAVEPKLLVCDEPVSALDVSIQAQILNLFMDLRERLGLAILFISHDLAVVRYLCDRVAVMSQGEIVEIGPRQQVYERPQHPYTQRLLAAG
jgi:ABC-type oligopeptide transport system ATPase subunit